MDDIAISGSDTSAPLNLLKRVGIISRYIDIRGLRVLDIGCGAGAFVAALGDLGAQAQGVEYVEDKIGQWRQRFPGDMRVQQGDAEHLSFQDDHFDIVIMNEVLEHIPSDTNALREAFRVLKKGGLFFNFTPNRFYPIETHGFIDKTSGAHRSGLRFIALPWLPLSISRKRVSFWCRNYWPWDLRRMTRSAGFKTLSHQFVWQTFENISGGKKRLIHAVSHQARYVANILEKTPVLKVFGASQLLISTK